MTMASSGQISLSGQSNNSATASNTVAYEIYGTNTNRAITMNDADLRTLAGKPSGGYSMSDFYGKSWYVPTMHTYTTVGTFTWTPSQALITALNVLVVAGGGKGISSSTTYAGQDCPGGGAGQATQNASFAFTGASDTLTIVVGAGGASSSGGSSSISSSSGGSISCAGGATGTGVNGTGGTSGNGHTGGASGAGYGGGGGGNSGNGVAGSSGGTGGAGNTYTINGNNYTVGVGGPGGNVGCVPANGIPGSPNTGNGGGGASHPPCCTAYSKSGGNGGSGLVVFYA